MVALSHLFTYFNSRPHGGRLFYRKLALRPHYFNSRPHGGRQGFCRRSGGCPDFNSRPHGGRRGTARNVPQNSAFQLTPSRRATHIIYCKLRMFKISTHALTEGDPGPGTHSPIPHHFNSRPHGGRLPIAHTRVKPNIFQLTPSRRATLLKSNFRSFSLISTHALTEGDKIHRCYMCLPRISTHALTEGDPFPRLLLCRKRNFNSRPHGGRRAFRMYMDAMKHFNSRPHGGRHFDVQLVQSI